MNDVNILTYSKSTENNCKTLSRLHDVCKRWAKQHKVIFVSVKYELIHLTRTLKKFNIKASLKINEINIKTKTDVKILDLQINIKFKWDLHVRKIENKIIKQTQVLHRLTIFTWRTIFAKVRQIYSAIIRSVITYDLII